MSCFVARKPGSWRSGGLQHVREHNRWGSSATKLRPVRQTSKELPVLLMKECQYGMLKVMVGSHTTDTQNRRPYQEDHRHARDHTPAGRACTCRHTVQSRSQS